MKRLYILWGVLAGAATLQAQEPEKTEAQLDRTVVVENLYNPDIMNANKISITPTLEEPQIPKKQIEYDTATKPSARFGFDPMNSFGQLPQLPDAKRGYLRLGYGNRGNADARLSYRFDLGERDEVKANVAFRGMDGEVDLPAGSKPEEWDARSYRTGADADWTHRFDSFCLKVNADGENQVFNTIWGTHRHNLMGGLRATLATEDDKAPIRWNAGMGLLYGAQMHAPLASGNWGRAAETLVRTHAEAIGDINGQNHVFLGVQMDNLFNKGLGKDYTSLQLNPAFLTGLEAWKLRLGMHVDFQFDMDKKLQVAPDVMGAYTLAKGYELYVQATGGRRINDFRTLNRLSAYTPVYIGAENTYTQLDGRFGLKATPLNELEVEAYAGYGIVKDELFGTPDGLVQDDGNTLYAGATARYAWKDFFTTQASLQWNHWDSDVLELCPTLCPELAFRLMADVQPIDGLHITLNYDYEYRTQSKGMARADAVNNLGLKAGYDLLSNLTVYMQGDNLLNRKYWQSILHPAQGLNVLAGVSVGF